MAAALVQFNEGTSAVAVTTASFDGATTAGNHVVLAFASDDYNGSPDSGWTESAEMEQQTFHGSYIWWRASAGETSFQYTIATAAPSCWVLMEWSGLDAAPYDISEGQFQQTSVSSYTTPNINPTVGDRLLVASIGSSLGGGGQSAPGSWTNSFTGITGVAAGSNPDAIGTSYRLVTADGGTSYSTGASWSGGNAQTESGLIIAFKPVFIPTEPPVIEVDYRDLPKAEYMTIRSAELWE